MVPEETDNSLSLALARLMRLTRKVTPTNRDKKMNDDRREKTAHIGNLLCPKYQLMVALS
jgi:hypothetical protein